MKISRFEKVAFFLSAAVLSFLYGYGSSAFGWFPDSLMMQAVVQGSQLVRPHYAVPKVYERHGARIVSPQDIGPGLTLISSQVKDGGWHAGLSLIDRHGRTVHEWPADPHELFSDVGNTRGTRAGDHSVHGSHLFPSGDVVLNIEYVGIARIDACGEVLWRLANGSHHSIARADDGTLWVPITGSAVRPSSDRFPHGYPGLDQAVNHDRLLHLSENGEPLDTISVLDVLYRNDLVRYLAKARVAVQTDWMHVNDVEPLPRRLADDYPMFDAGDLLLSLRASDLVLVFDPETEVVKWYASDPFVQQHDPDFMGGGWIGVFDNRRDGTDRGELLGGNRIVALQPHTDSLKVLFPTPASDPFYTEILGKWQTLENGNLLLTEGRAGRVVEVAPDGRTVWDWVQKPYSESYVVEVAEGTRYPITREEVANWSCSSPQSSSGGIEETDHE